MRVFLYNKRFYLNYEGCKCEAIAKAFELAFGFIGTMRDVNLAVAIFGALLAVSFIGTMRDVNLNG